jgi:hypothetical protein
MTPSRLAAPIALLVVALPQLVAIGTSLRLMFLAWNGRMADWSLVAKVPVVLAIGAVDYWLTLAILTWGFSRLRSRDS